MTKKRSPTKLWQFAVVFGLVGATALVFSFAATPVPDAFEPEVGSTTTPATVASDTNASGGKYVQFQTAGTTPPVMTHDVTPLAAGTQFTFKEVIQKASGQPAKSDGTGNFRVGCNYSHMSYDDPIVYPGQPGKSHLHTFFGNSTTDANSTYTSLRNATTTTCDGGTVNKSAYWIPTLINPSNVAQKPSLGFVYYKSSGYTLPALIHHIPSGIRIIAGNPNATSPQPTIPNQLDPPLEWYCTGAEQSGVLTNSTPQQIPASCPKGFLTMSVIFPQCWDGVNLDTPDHRSHMSYPDYSTSSTKSGCDAGHPIAIPEITIFGSWPVPGGSLAGWRLSSDMYTGGAGGYSGHADYMEAWDPAIRDTFVDNCDAKPVDCGGPAGVLLGDGRELGPYYLFDGN